MPGDEAGLCQPGRLCARERRNWRTHDLDFCARALVGLALARSGGVNRHKVALDLARLLDLLHERLGLVPLTVDVELHEEGLLGALGARQDLGQRRARVGRDLRATDGVRVSHRAPAGRQRRSVSKRTNWAMPVLPAALAKSFSPSGWLSLAMPHGQMKIGRLTS